MKKQKNNYKQKTVFAVFVGVVIISGLAYYLSQTQIWKELFAGSNIATSYKIIRLEGPDARVNDISVNRNGVGGYIFDDENSMQYAALWNKQGKLISKIRASDGGDMTYYQITDKVYTGFVEKKYGTYPNGYGYIYSFLNGDYPAGYFIINNGKITRFNKGSTTKSSQVIGEKKEISKAEKDVLQNLIKAYPVLKNYPSTTQDLFLRPFVAQIKERNLNLKTFEPRDVNNKNHILGFNYTQDSLTTAVFVNGAIKNLANSKILASAPKGYDTVVGYSLSNANYISGMVFNLKLYTLPEYGFTYQYSTDPSTPISTKIWKPILLNEPGARSMISNINDDGKALMHEAFSERGAFFSTLAVIDVKNPSAKPVNISQIITDRTGRRVVLNGSVGIATNGDVIGAAIQQQSTGDYTMRYYIFNYNTKSLKFFDEMMNDGTLVGAENWDYLEPWSIADDGSVGAFCLKGDLFDPSSDLAGCILVPNK